ncbi:hypothetical protein DWY22_08045 [Heyndrickxia coagulans]|nr:hypothetical protein DWY22_08045 [Heyndrickxia coagulans]RGR98247.1 hypothetical protein DWY16_08520 [Heyndrickxia coagulans]
MISCFLKRFSTKSTIINIFIHNTHNLSGKNLKVLHKPNHLSTIFPQIVHNSPAYLQKNRCMGDSHTPVFHNPF